MKNLYENLCFAIGLILVGSSFANETPVYSGASAQLDIPNVQVEGVAGAYQDITMKFDDGDTLRMSSVREGVLLDQINMVSIIQTNTFPVQVFLEVSGDFPTGCGDIGQINQSLSGNTLDVRVHYENDDWLKNPELVPCTLAMRPFWEVIPLDVYGLQAGTYHYNLNNEFTGSFTLANNNIVSEAEPASLMPASALQPSYSPENAVLMLPSIDLNNQPGYYQLAELKLVQDNLWQLLDVKEGKRNENITRVELIQTDSFPAQVLLKITGEFTHGCAAVGQTLHKRTDNIFVVSSYYQNNIWTETPEVVLCAQVMQPFSYVYPLPVYGLAAGDYDYEVNGEFSGVFTLTRNNRYETSSPAW